MANSNFLVAALSPFAGGALIGSLGLANDFIGFLSNFFLGTLVIFLLILGVVGFGTRFLAGALFFFF
jgi:hypothetical protein